MPVGISPRVRVSAQAGACPPADNTWRRLSSESPHSCDRRSNADRYRKRYIAAAGMADGPGNKGKPKPWPAMVTNAPEFSRQETADDRIRSLIRADTSRSHGGNLSEGDWIIM